MHGPLLPLFCDLVNVRTFYFYRILFTVKVLTGGMVYYVSRSDINGLKSNQSYAIKGIEKQSDVFEIEFDFQKPTHCYELQDDCSDEPLTTNGDFLSQVSFD